MAQSSALINKNRARQETHNFLYTSMVSHRGIPVSFAMREDGKIFYSVLDMSNTAQKTDDNDKNFWSDVRFDVDGVSSLNFPNEITRVGYAVAPNYRIPFYDSSNQKVIHRVLDGKFYDAQGKELSLQAIKDQTDSFYSSTARLGAKAPFQVLSDTKYIYVFRQSIDKDDPCNERTDPTDTKSTIVNNTLLVDRFILSGSFLKPSREVRYQRSQHKTEPQSRKDTLSAVDVEGNPFYEPTRELVFANELIDGNFSVLLIPGTDSEEQRWQIFTQDAATNRIKSFNLRFDYSIVFDTSDSNTVVEAFLTKYGMGTGFIAKVQEKIRNGKTDKAATNDLYQLADFNYNSLNEGAQKELTDALNEVIYTIRTGVSKDDFILESTSEWPLIEYEADGQSIKSEYLNQGALKKEFTFQGNQAELKPKTSPYTPKHGLSSCYYYQQELGPDGKPMKNKACVMLATGLEDGEQNNYIGILNFAVGGTGHLSRFTTDSVNMPDINVQALDENPYDNLNSINQVAWQPPQKMSLLDIDPNGLSTSGGVLKFAYTSAEIGTSQGYSDAVVATNPYLFDDSLGRVNLYFKGKEKNFFVLYFNPTGSKSASVSDSQSNHITPPLALKPRLDRDMDLNVTATLPANTNSCTFTMKSGNEVVEKWDHLPRRFTQIAGILNGNATLPLGTLDPVGVSGDLRAAYQKPASGNGTFILRTTSDNNLLFSTASDAYAPLIADGNSHNLSLGNVSTFLSNNPHLKVANKSFSVTGNVSLKADLFYKTYLAGLVDVQGDIDKLWNYLKTQSLIQAVSGTTDRSYLKAASLTGSSADLATTIADTELDNLSLDLLSEGNDADKKAKRARLKLSMIELIMDVAKVRLVTLSILDTNTQKVDRLEAGLELSVGYNYSTHFNCTPSKLGGTSAPEWGHPRSYLFNASVEYDGNTNTSTEVTAAFNYQYVINNAIGQWEDWEASLALDFTGAALNNTDPGKLDLLSPSEKGLSLEAWIKPSSSIGSKVNIVYFKKGNEHYSLGIEKEGGSKYKCFAKLGDQKYTTENSFDSQKSGADQWRHLAFSHKKYWGYHLGSNNQINCGDDSSLQFTDEFTLEVLVKIDSAGTLLEKKGEYRLSVGNNREVAFIWSEKNCLTEMIGAYPNKPDPLNGFNQFYKITLIRSRKAPQKEPSQAEYPLTGGDQGQSGSGSPKKWYEDKESDDVLKGMAEKQNQMDEKLGLSTASMFGLSPSPSEEDPNPKYFHSLVVTQEDGASKTWTSTISKKVDRVEAFKNFILGGSGFSGTFASVRVWNRALSLGDAKLFFLPENKAGLSSHWRISEGKGHYLYDNVSENHGVVDGGSWRDSPQSNQPGQFVFYVDGTEEKHDTSPEAIVFGDDQLGICGIKRGNSYANSYKGTLEEVRIWNVPRTNEQITDNAFGRLKGEWELLLANYTFDRLINQSGNLVQDSSMNTIPLSIHNQADLNEVLSTAPIATEIPQVRSALTGVLTAYNDTLHSQPGVVEYGDVQKNDDGTLNGILKRCYSFIDGNKKWNRMTGYKVGNLISQWYSQAQFDPQVMGYMEGPPPVPAENFPGDQGTGSLRWNSVSFKQAEEVSYNYSTSKESGWKVAVDSDNKIGVEEEVLIAPLGFGFSVKLKAGIAAKSNWETSGSRSQSYARGTSVSTSREFNALLSGYADDSSNPNKHLKMGNTGYALVKSKTADIYLLRLAHNHALVSISWQPNPDIPEDVNIIPFPINPLYTKQGTLDGKSGETTDPHYPQAHGGYGQYSYFKPREAYKLKKQIEREKMELKTYFEDSFDVAKTGSSFQAAAATTGIAQLAAFIPSALGPLITSIFNQSMGQLATQVGYNNTDLKNDLAEMGSQRNLVNTYVWTVEGGFFAESTQVTETTQETFSNTTSLSLGGGMGMIIDAASVFMFEQKTMASTGSSFTLTKSKTKSDSSSFGLDLSIRIPTSPRYKYAGTDQRTLSKGLIKPGTVDAYRFMTFYLEPKGKNFADLFSKVIDPVWLEENPDPNAQALRQARGKVDRPKPCWRIMHRVTYVSRILPEFQPEAPPSLEKSLRVSGIESNFMLIKKFEPYVANLTEPGAFFSKIEQVIDVQLPEFKPYKRQIKKFLGLYYNIDQE